MNDLLGTEAATTLAGLGERNLFLALPLRLMGSRVTLQAGHVASEDGNVAIDVLMMEVQVG